MQSERGIKIIFTRDKCDNIKSCDTCIIKILQGEGNVWQKIIWTNNVGNYFKLVKKEVKFKNSTQISIT